MFHWGIGLLPYKDTFYSNTTEHSSRVCEGCKDFDGQEPQPLLHALMSVLSASFVTVSDAASASNASLLQHLYRADGMLLKPTRPVTAMDAQLLANVFGNSDKSAVAEQIRADVDGVDGHLYSTYSNVSNLQWTMVVGVKLSAPFVVYPAHIGLVGGTTEWVTYQYDFAGDLGSEANTALSTFDDQHPITIANTSGSSNPYAIQYHIVAPVLSNGVVLIGELHKFVPIATQRIIQLEFPKAADVSSNHVVLQLSGAEGEKVSITFAEKEGAFESTGPDHVDHYMFVTTTLTCTVGGAGVATLHYPGGACYH